MNWLKRTKGNLLIHISKKFMDGSDFGHEMLKQCHQESVSFSILTLAFFWFDVILNQALLASSMKVETALGLHPIPLEIHL